MVSYSIPLVSCSQSTMMTGHYWVNMMIIECLYGTFNCFYSFLTILIMYLIHQILNLCSLHLLSLLLSLRCCIILPFLSIALLNFYCHLKAKYSYFFSLYFVQISPKMLFQKYKGFKFHVNYFYTLRVHSIYERYFIYPNNYHSQ